MKQVVFLILILLLANRAFSNDTSAVIGAGGIQFQKSSSISMESENLYISKDLIKVDYIFKNSDKLPIKTIVAFPLPKVDTGFSFDEFTSTMYPNIGSENYLNFKLQVNGKTTKFDTEFKAFVNDRDITSILKKHGIHVSALSGKHSDSIRSLPYDVKKRLLMDGIIAPLDEDPNQYSAAWSLLTTLYWTQVFPPNKPVKISHQYQPVVGGWQTTSAYFIETGSKEEKKYCIDSYTKKGILNFSLKKGRKYILIRQIKYILTTGNNWKGSIKNFRLIIDKGSPDNIISLCVNNIKKISPTQFLFEAKNFHPLKDIEVLIIE